MAEQKKKIDYNLLLAVAVLLALSLTFIYTASSAKAFENYGDATFFLKRQVFRILLAAVVLYFAMRIDYHVFLDYAPWFFWGALTLLLVLLFAPEEWTVRSTRRWLSIMGFRFQPSELAKIALILMFARILTLKSVEIRSFTDGVLPQLILTGIVCTAVLLQPDAGTSIMIFLIIASMLFIAGARIWHLLALLGAGISAVFMMLMSVPYQRSRLMAFVEAFKDETQIGWQVKQSLISLGNGGLFGVGLGESKQKLHWLPDPFTDFIFSIIGEELGLIGTLLVTALFLVIVFRGFRIAMSAPDNEGRLLALGITISIGLYAFMNMAVVLHLIPTTGIPMPFVSYGGSALIINMFGVGMLLNICQQGNERGLTRVLNLEKVKQAALQLSIKG